MAWKWGAYLGDEGIKQVIRAKVSSFTRPGINSVMAKGKVVGHYVNSILAKREVLAAGYRTGDIFEPGMKKVSCSEMGDQVVAAL